MTAHIYVVDDTPHTLQLMTYLLQAHAHRVTGFSNAEAALAALEAGERPDLILMDLQLKGGIDGYEALSRLRSVPAPVVCPVVAVTAFAMVGDREQALRRGFAGYLSKPIDPYAFADQVDHFLPPGLAGRAPSTAGQSNITGHSSAATPAETSGLPVVLVVDDVASNVDMIDSVLRAHGYTVAGASSIAAALAAAHDARPVLILSDIHLGQESGFDLRQRLLADPDLATIPFAFTTATAVDLQAPDTTAAIIRRPFAPATLADTVARLIHADSRT